MRLFVEGEAGFDGDLPVGDGAVLDVAAGLDDLEPAEVAQGLAGAVDGVLDGGLDAMGGGADEFDQFVGVLAHSMQNRMGMRARGYLGAEAARDGGGWEGKIRVFFRVAGVWA